MPEMEGRIPGFNDRWNKRQCHVINKEDMLRWTAQDRLKEADDKPRKTVLLGRSHSCIGPYPGCRRNAELSPRKSASMCFLEQKLTKSSHADPKCPQTRELLYEGVSREGQGRTNYLKLRASQNSVHERFGHVEPGTSAMSYGFKKPVFSGPKGEYKASKFCHKPGVEEGFFRPNGAQTYLNLP